VNQIVPYKFSALVEQEKQAATALAAWEVQQPLINAQVRDRHETYYKVEELNNVWRWLYANYVFPAMRNPKHIEVTRRQLDAIIEVFDAVAVTALVPVGAKHTKITKLLWALKAAVCTPASPRRLAFLMRDTLERAEERRLERIRKLTDAVSNELLKMQNRAATPALLRRTYDRWWGKPGAVLDLGLDKNNPYRSLAKEVIKATISKKIDKLLSSNIAEAFRTLGLESWATEEEMQKRFEDLMKQFHPDRHGGDKEMAVKLNRARDTLKAYYQGSEPGPR
jgi:hypothetical protein